MEFIPSISLVLSSYLIGSIPWGFLLVRWFRGIDIRRFGSGNIGFTNVLRVAGKPLAGLVLLLDGGKGYLSVAVLAPWALRLGEGGAGDEYRITAFCAVVAGHIFPVFLRFQGGKGVATAAGALLALNPTVFILCLAAWLIPVVIFRRVSLGSIIAAPALPVFIYFITRSWSDTFFSFVPAILIIIRHLGNIRRLMRGEEPLIFSAKK